MLERGLPPELMEQFAPAPAASNEPSVSLTTQLKEVTIQPAWKSSINIQEVDGFACCSNAQAISLYSTEYRYVNRTNDTFRSVEQFQEWFLKHQPDISEISYREILWLMTHLPIVQSNLPHLCNSPFLICIDLEQFPELAKLAEDTVRILDQQTEGYMQSFYQKLEDEHPLYRKVYQAYELRDTVPVSIPPSHSLQHIIDDLAALRLKALQCHHRSEKDIMLIWFKPYNPGNTKKKWQKPEKELRIHSDPKNAFLQEHFRTCAGTYMAFAGWCVFGGILLTLVIAETYIYSAQKIIEQLVVDELQLNQTTQAWKEELQKGIFKGNKFLSSGRRLLI